MTESSFRPKYSDAPRCGQFSCISPIRPVVSLKATRFSPSSRTRAGAPPGSGISAVRQAGVQYRRSSSPISVPGPTRVRISLSSALSMLVPPTRVERFGEGGVFESGEHPPVLSWLEDLLGAEDGPEVEAGADGRRFLARGQALGGGDEEVPHPGDGLVGGAELLLGAVVDGAHRLGHHEVLADEVRDAAERGGPLDVPVDQVVVLRGVPAGDDPVGGGRYRRRERGDGKQVRAAEVARVPPGPGRSEVAPAVVVVDGD